MQSPHFISILFFLSYEFDLHTQDKFNVLIQTAVHFNVPLDVYHSNEIGLWPGL
jgi:hypothetical protein